MLRQFLGSKSLQERLLGSIAPVAQALGSSSSCPQPSSLHHRDIHTTSAAHAKDYYAVLGVPKSASDQEVKKAFYQLAKQFHPDTNKDNKDAASKFQEVQKAYETLRDPEKRRIYDQVGPEGMERMESGDTAGANGFRGGPFPGGFPFGGFSAESIFEQIFNQDPMYSQMFGRMAVQPIRISFMEAIKGTKRRISLAGLRGPAGASTPEHVDLDIPAGVDSGDQMQIETTLGPRQRVRLAVPIEVEPHPVFRRDGADIKTVAELSLPQAMLGATLTVQTVDGNAEMLVPPCTQNGANLRLRGKGVFNQQTGSRGDQYVEIRVLLPRVLNGRQKELLLEFEREEAAKKGR